MRSSCQRKKRARRLLLVACGAAVLAVLFYCVPWWVFLIIGIVSLLLALYRFLSDV